MVHVAGIDIDKDINEIVKEMYDMRKIVHGSASLRSSETEFIKVE